MKETSMLLLSIMAQSNHRERMKFICQVHNNKLPIKIVQWQATRNGISPSMLATLNTNTIGEHASYDGKKIRKNGIAARHRASADRKQNVGVWNVELAGESLDRA